MPINYKEFAAKIKAKYPDYAEVDDKVLAKKMVEKFPGSYDVSFDDAKEGFATPQEFQKDFKGVPAQDKPSPYKGTSAYQDARSMLSYPVAGLESIPDELGAIDLKKEFPYVGIHGEKAAALQGGVGARVKSIQEDPNFLESVLTDPITYAPGVGEYAAVPKLARYVVDPVLQAAAEFGLNPGIDASEAGIQAGVGTGITAGLGKLGKVLKGKSLEGFADRYGVDNRSAEVLSEDVPNVGSTRKSISNAPGGKVDEVLMGLRNQMDPDQTISFYGKLANNARNAIDEFRAGTRWSKQYSATGEIPSVAETRRWEAKIKDFEDDVTNLMRANSNSGDYRPQLSKEQVTMLLKQYSDVPPLANELRSVFQWDTWSAPARERYLAKAPQKMDYSIPGVVAGTLGKAGSPENLTRESRVANWLSGKAQFPVVGVASMQGEER
jgi:hypothetical protein